MSKQHPVRYSTIDPNTGAEWNFINKRRSGVKHRWEREVINEEWGEIRWKLKGQEAVIGSTDYVTNTVRLTKKFIAENNGKIIGVLEKYAKGRALQQQFEKAWYTIREDIKKLYGKKMNTES